VIIRGDRSANLGRAIAILNCCKNANIQNVSFAAVQEEPEGGR
jgi:biopolymer transport protein ExbD